MARTVGTARGLALAVEGWQTGPALAIRVFCIAVITLTSAVGAVPATAQTATTERKRVRGTDPLQDDRAIARNQAAACKADAVIAAAKDRLNADYPTLDTPIYPVNARPC